MVLGDGISDRTFFFNSSGLCSWSRSGYKNLGGKILVAHFKALFCLCLYVLLKYSGSYRLSAFVSAQSIFFCSSGVSCLSLCVKWYSLRNRRFSITLPKMAASGKRATEPKQAATQAKDINIDIFSTVLKECFLIRRLLSLDLKRVPMVSSLIVLWLVLTDRMIFTIKMVSGCGCFH